jgi:hypothetical protein
MGRVVCPSYKKMGNDKKCLNKINPIFYTDHNFPVRNSTQVVYMHMRLAANKILQDFRKKRTL